MRPGRGEGMTAPNDVNPRFFYGLMAAAIRAIVVSEKCACSKLIHGDISACVGCLPAEEIGKKVAQFLELGDVLREKEMRG